MPTQFKTQTILLVEDEVILAMNEKMQLEKYGYSVLHVPNGEKAVQTITDNTHPVDLILMDINLGSGIDGTQAAEIILKDHDIPIVFLSSHTDPEVVEKTEKITSYGYVVKNSSITVLDASIKMAFRLFDANRNLKNELVERKRAEQKIQEIDVRMRKLFANVPELIYQFTRRPDGSYYVPIASDGVRNIFGCSPEDVLDNYEPISKVIYPEDAARVFQDIEYSAEHLTYFTSEFRVHIPGKDIQWILSRSTPEKLPDGSITWYGFNADITDQKRAEEAIKEQRDFSESLIETAQAIILVLDTRGRIVQFNPYTEKLLGYRLDEVKGMDWIETFTCPQSGDSVKSALQKTLDDNQTRAYVNPIIAKDGRTILVEWYNKTLQDADGCTIGILATGNDITDGKRAETELAESVKLLSRAQEIAHIGNWHLDLTANRLSWSDEIYRLFGCEPQEFAVTYEAFLDFVHPDDRAAVDSAYTRSVQEGNNGYEIEHRIVRRDSGDVRYVHERCDHERDDTGTIIGSIGMVQDITKHKQAEEAVTQKTKLLEASQVLAKLGSWEWDISHDTWYFSEQWKKIHGVSDNDFDTSKLMEIAHPEDAPYIEKAFSEATEQGKPYDIEHRIIRADNREIRYVKALGEVLFDQDTGRPVRMVGVTQDITGQKQAEKELAFQNIFMKTQMEASLDGILTVDEDNKITSFNQRFADIWEIPDSIMSLQSSEKALQYVLPKLTNPDEFAARIHDLQKNKQEKSHEEIALTDGRILERYSSPMLGSNGEYHGRIWFYRDITERKLTEEEILKQLSEKEMLLREIHHRVKNNIATVESFLSLQIRDSDSAEVKTALQDAISRVQSTRVLYEKLLISKNLRTVSIKGYAEGLIDSLVMVFDPDKNTTVETRVADIEVDARKAVSIGIIINELLTNVFKYAFKDRDNGLVSVSIEKEESAVTLTIQDNGVGFDERARKNKSPGFGLTIVKMLVEQLRGTYSISNENGTRSVVQFAL